MRIRILPFNLTNADPELTIQFLFRFGPFNATRLQPFHFYADPDPAFQFNADPDPAFHFDGDPDPQHCNGNYKGRDIVYGRICLHAENNVTQGKDGAIITIKC
jgi:hypothetical protein